MSTQLETTPPSYSQHTLPPNYSSTEAIELGQLRATASADSLPQYDTVYQDTATSPEASSSSSASSFHPTTTLQIQTRGQPLFSSPLCPPVDDIYVHPVSPTGAIDPVPVLVSVRPKPSSGTCFLARADDPSLTPLCKTTYRFGPGKPPKIRLLLDSSSPSDEAASSEDIIFDCKSAFSRATCMRTPHGTFEWRYATRAERRALGPEVDSLLVLDLTTTVALTGGKSETRRTQVGRFARGAGGLRTEGTKRSWAGNGGRLSLDLRRWAEGKGEAERVEVLAVASCVSMLKKEVDRRRFQQSMVFCAAASGGGP